MRIRHWQKYLLLFFAILCSLPSILNHVNYNNLENLLVQKQWLKADRETTELMLKISERKMHGYIDDNSFKRIHCQDLNRINSFWLKYSRNHFGFTIQKEILDDLMTYDHGDFDTVFEKIC